MNTLTLSDRLDRAAAAFSGLPEIHMTGLSASQFAAGLRILASEARRLEGEIDRLQWALAAANDPIRNGPDVMARALAEIERMVTASPPGSRAAADRAADEAILAGLSSGEVTLFPIVKRPAFCDGRADGGAS